MKALIFTVSCLISSYIFACPDISGEFLNCKVITGGFYDHPSYVIKQIKRGGITKLFIDQKTSEDESEWLIADGKKYSIEYSIPDTDAKGFLVQSTICSGSKVITEAVHKVSGVEKPYSFMRIFEKKGRKLVIEYYDDIYGNKSKSKYICD